MLSREIKIGAIALTLLWSCSNAVSGSERYGEPVSEMPATPGPEGMSGTKPPAESYGGQIGKKLGGGLANVATGWLEIPKTVINTTNEYNVALGLTGGLFKGILHMMGRTAAGALDLITFPLPTEPVVQPEFIWKDFNVETHYEPVFNIRD